MYDDTVTLIPATDYTKVRYGLITPEGELYSCGYTDHCYLQDELERIGVLDENHPMDYDGCVHVSGATFDDITEYQSHRRVTQKQLDTMFDYMLANEKTFPFELVEVIDAKKDSTAKTRAVGPVFQSISA